MSDELSISTERATKITKAMLDISTETYGFQDVYIGRLPRLIHEIPEADIWECNPEYTGLIYMYLEGTLIESNISQELLRQVQDDIILVSRLDLIKTYEQKKIATCVGFGPTGNIGCNDELDCDELLICDYEPFNVYRKYAPAYVSDFVSSEDRVHEIEFDWSLSTHGTQPIKYDIYRMLAGMGNETTDDDKWLRIAEDVEPGIVIYEPYGEYIYRLRVYNIVGEIYSYRDVGKSLMPSPLGKDCCTNDMSTCLNYNVVGDYDLPTSFITTDGFQFTVGIWHGSCDGSSIPEQTECDMPEDCDGEMCPSCIGLNVYGRDCLTGEYGFLKFHANDDRFYTSDSHGTCIQIEGVCGSGYVCDDCADCTDLHVWDNDIREYVDFFTVNDLDFQVAIGCPDCVDFNVCDNETKKPVNLIANGQYYVISSEHGKCGSTNKMNPPYFGLDERCEPAGDCIDYRVFNKNTSSFDNLIDNNDIQFDVSYSHGSCGIDNTIPDSGYTCDPATTCPDCVNLNIWNGSTYVDFFAAGLDVQISRIHGTCGTGIEPPVLPEFGLDCIIGVDCPSCVQLKSYDSINNVMGEFILSDGGKMFISPVHGTCGSPYGLDCDGDCPDCINLNVWVTGSTFQNFNSNLNNMVVSHEHDSCTVTPPPILDYGYQCDPGTDCPDCITFKSLSPNGTEFDTYSPNSSDSLMIGWEHEGCGTEIPPPVGTEWGYSCDEGVDCPDCITFYVYDGFGVMRKFVPDLNDSLMAGWEHEGCAGEVIPPDPTPGSAPEVEFYANPTKGVSPMSVVFTDVSSNTPTSWSWTFGDGGTSTTQSPTYEYSSNGIYDVTLEATNVDGTGSGTKTEYITTMDSTGLQCTAGVDCPNCNQFNVMNEAGNGYELFVVSNGYLKVGYESESCASFPIEEVAPNAPTVVNATDNQTGQVTITWVNSTIGIPTPVYRLYRDGGVISYDATSPYVEIIEAGTYNYTVQAYNSKGTASDSNSGESIGGSTGTAPNAPTGFNATDNEIGQITMTWTNSTIGDPVPTYDLYDGTSMIVSGITSGYVYALSSGSGTYKIRAVNNVGYADSNTNSGTSIVETKQGFSVNVVGSSDFDRFVVDGDIFYVSLD